MEARRSVIADHCTFSARADQEGQEPVELVPSAREPLDLTASRLVGRLTAALVRLSCRRPVVTIAASALLAVVAALYTVEGLAFVTSPVRLLPQHARYVRLMKEYLDDFGAMQGIVVAVQARTPAGAKEYAKRLAVDLRQGGLAANISYRVDPASFEERGLLYLSTSDLTTIRDRLFDYREFVEAYAARPTLARLFEGLGQQLANAMAVGLFDLGLDGRHDADLGFLQGVLDRMRGALDGDAAYRSPWPAAFSLGRLDDPDAGYFFSADRRLLFLFVEEPREADTDAHTMVRAIRASIRRLSRSFPAVEAGVTGSAAVSDDEMTTAFKDSQAATALAFAISLGLLLAAFRRVGAPLLILVALTVSLVWSLGLITLVVGQLNIFSVMFISMVVGIGTDYGIYLLYRVDEERAFGAPQGAALSLGAEKSGLGMLLGVLTAVGTFIVLMLTDFQGIREFGLISGIAILTAYLSMVTLLPALLTLTDRGSARRSRRERPESGEREARWLARITRYRKTILAVAAALTALSIWGAAGVAFSYNMLKLQARGTESVVWQERVLAAGGDSGFPAITTASSLEDLRRKQDAFAALPSVAKVESVLEVVPDHQREKMAIVREFAPLVASIRVASRPAFEPGSLREPLAMLRRRLAIFAREAKDEKVRADLHAAVANVDALMGKLEATAPSAVAAALGPFQAEVARDFADRMRRFQRSLAPRPIAIEDLPQELRERYVGTSGRLLIRIDPAVDIWERAGAERFVREIRSVDPDVTGPPVTSFEAIRMIQRGYFLGTLYALVLVAAMTAATFWSARGTALALLPLALGVLWTLGLMRVFDLRFTLANVWALPLIIGTAAEFGLNIYVRFVQAREGGGPALGQSTVMAVLLNGLMTMGGFASLMVATHRGIFGLGLLLTIGSAAVLFAALLVLPVVIHLLAGPAVTHPPSDHSGITTFASR